MRPNKRRTRYDLLDALFACGFVALGIATLATGKPALGVLSLVYVPWLFSTWVVNRRGSDRAKLRVVLIRPFFLGTWLLALAAVVIAGRTSRDWIVILPLAIAWLALGCGLLIFHRRAGRRDKT
jgi:hypothetical protein